MYTARFEAGIHGVSVSWGCGVELNESVHECGIDMKDVERAWSSEMR